MLNELVLFQKLGSFPPADKRLTFLVVGQVEDHVGKPFSEVGIIGILPVEFDSVCHDLEHDSRQHMIASQARGQRNLSCNSAGCNNEKNAGRGFFP